MYLNDFIHVNNKIARSVNIERDATNIEQIRHFQITPMARRVLKRFIDALKGEPETAWSLTGPYGTGKSSFCNFLYALCADARTSVGKAALSNLKLTDPSLCKKFVDAKQIAKFHSFLPLRAVSRYESINKTLLRSLDDTFQVIRTKQSIPLIKAIANLKEKDVVQTPDIIGLLEEASKVTKKKLLVVVDEFGKNLEYMTHNPSDGDIFVLQALAESNFSYLWVCLHQAFSEYASALSQAQYREWRKVQGRFDDISYLEPPSHVINLISRAIRQKKDKNDKQWQLALKQWAKTHRDLQKGVKIDGVSRLGLNKIKKLYPFSPLSAVVLGELSHRFAQNDRTIFSFLSNGAPKSLSGYLSRHKIEQSCLLPTMPLDWLYDYFCEITTQVHGDRSTTQQWVEIQAMISKHENGPSFELKLLKTIGVLNLLSKIPGISASREMIHLAVGFGDVEKEKSIDKALHKLTSSRTLLYREYADEFRLWEGSDFNLETAILEERARLSLGTLEKMLEIAAPQPSVIAARHSFQTGVVREFKQTWTTLDLLNDREGNELVPCPNADGQIWLVLGKGQAPDSLSKKTKNRPIVIGYAPYENQVLDLSLDAAAAKKVFQSHTQLSRDGVARREARFRVDAAADILKKFLADLVAPSTQKIQWYAGGKPVDIRTGRGISGVVSGVCDQIFKHGPIVHMEMINHNKLTAAAARAQRELMEAMVTSESQKELGLEGFGPEKAIYLAMFASPGLHIFNDEKNIWQFQAPDPENESHAQLAMVWKKLNNVLKDAERKEKGVSLANLIHILQAPPYGLRKGPIPIFLCHYILVNNDRVALYQEGAFQPFFGAAEAALMVKRPDLFQLHQYSLEGGHRDVVQAYMSVFDTGVLEFDENARNQSLLMIIGPLVEFMEALPVYSRNTRDISQEAQRLRSAVLHSREPLTLLFKDIPKALGLPVFTPGEKESYGKIDLHSKLHSTLIELADAYKSLNDMIKLGTQKAFDFIDGFTFNQFRKELQRRVSPLEKPCGDKHLRTTLKAILNIRDEDDQWAAGIAGAIMKKPLDVWRDSDIDSWHVGIDDIANRILAFETLVRGSTGTKDKNRISFSLTRVNGKTDSLVVNVSLEQKKKLLGQYPGIKTLNEEDKKSLCAILLEELGKDNAE